MNTQENTPLSKRIKTAIKEVLAATEAPWHRSITLANGDVRIYRGTSHNKCGYFVKTIKYKKGN